MRLELVEHCWR